MPNEETVVTQNGKTAGSGGSAPAWRQTEGPILAEAKMLDGATGQGGRTGHAMPDWRPFLRALAAEIDAMTGTAGRDALLRGVGLQLARMYPMPARDSLGGLAMEMQEILEAFGWGTVRIAFLAAEHCLVLTHEGLPRVGGAGDPPGAWLASVLVGLYEGWMAQQPGSDASLVARRVASARPDEIVIRYGKE
jgi:hypothetical protein